MPLYSHILSIFILQGGLTALGLEFIKKAEQLGIMVDLAHSSEELVGDLLKHVTKPVVVSHTGTNQPAAFISGCIPSLAIARILQIVA